MHELTLSAEVTVNEQLHNALCQQVIESEGVDPRSKPDDYGGFLADIAIGRKIDAEGYLTNCRSDNKIPTTRLKEANWDYDGIEIPYIPSAFSNVEIEMVDR